MKGVMFGAASVLALSVAATSARAQGTAAEASPGAAPQVEEVIVTAQRRSENLQNVPIAVTALSGSELQAAGVATTAELAVRTPGLVMANTVGLQLPRIRGVGTTSAGAGIENSVATYIDGVYIASAPASLVTLNDVARVEVLKGPQGTLFGRNATGGLIQVVTKDPSSVFGGEASASYGAYATTRASLYVSGPVSDAVAADLAVSLGHQGKGYGHNLATGKDIYRDDRDIALRSKWLLHIGENTQVRLTGDYENIEGSNPAISALSGTRPSFAAGRVYSDPWDANVNVEPKHRIQSGGLSARIDHDFGAFSLVSITAGRRLDFRQVYDGDVTPSPILQIQYHQKDRQFSQEVQLQSADSSRIKWVVGAYYFDLDAKYDPYTTVFAPPLPNQSVVIHPDSKTRSLAAFGQATAPLGADTNLTVGIRYTHDRRELSGLSQVISGAGAVLATTRFSPRATYNTPTWRISLDHHFSDQLMGYVSYNRGYRSGGFSGQAPTAPEYRPEHIDAYEAGLKADLFDRRLRINAETFYYNYKDIQVNTYVNSASIIYNGARAETYGADVEFRAAVTDRLSLNGGLELLHDRFKDFPAAVVAVPQPDGSVRIQGGSATGNKLPFTPDFTLNVGGSYAVPLRSGELEFRVNEYYSTGFYAQPDNVLKQDAYSLLNAAVVWTAPHDRYTVSLFGENLLNKSVVVLMTATTAGDAVSYQPPRTYGVRLGLKF